MEVKRTDPSPSVRVPWSGVSMLHLGRLRTYLLNIKLAIKNVLATNNLGSDLTHKNKTRQQRLAGEQQSSFFVIAISDKEESLETFTAGNSVSKLCFLCH
jgi:hypothetical protein